MELQQSDRVSRKFDLYRYQLQPLTRNVQLDFLRETNSIETLKARKNEFFAETLIELQKRGLHHRKTEIIQRLDMSEGDWFVFHFASRKSLSRSNRDFNIERMDDWPNVIVIINNSPDVQGIAISRNTKAFSRTSVLAKALVANLQSTLQGYQLHIEIEALFATKTFWSLVSQYRGMITSLTFELVSPNMPSISKTLEIDLARINAETNSHRTDIKLKSGEGSSLELRKENTIVNSLVKYASSGGGDIVLRVRGLKKSIRTSKNIREIEIDELVLENLNPKVLESFLDFFKS
jgi:hypothetical protein